METMTTKKTIEVRVVDALRADALLAERDALRREVLKYQKAAHDSNVVLITAIQLLREVWSDYGKRADISAVHLEEIENFLRGLG